MKSIRKLLHTELLSVEATLSLLLNSGNSQLSEMGQQLQASGGKRLRPIIFLAIAKMCAPKEKPSIKLAAALEMFHAASLVHDDIIDNAETRRGNISLNQRYDNAKSLLCGNWIYAKAVEQVMQARNWDLSDAFFNTLQQMLSGELSNLQQKDFTSLKKKQIISNISCKTAALYQLCADAAAILAGADNNSRKQASEFAYNYGMGFQLMDDIADCLDGSDLKEGNLSYPYWKAWKAMSAEQRATLQLAFKTNATARHIEEAQELVLKTDAIEQTHSLASKYMSKARQALSCFPESDYRLALEQLLLHTLSYQAKKAA